MDFSVLTIFPDLVGPLWSHGIVRRAIDSGTIQGRTVNIRDFAQGRHRVTDDRPFGGGSGMVMKPEPLAGAIRFARKASPQSQVILLSPQGMTFDQETARQFAALEGLILVCGRYEGIDERIVTSQVDAEVSIGDYVLSGGELAAMVIIEAVTRLLPGALGGEAAAETDTFAEGRVEHAHYTRPRVFEGEPVPEVLLSGNHRRIDRWRLENAVIRTFLKRPDLLRQTSLEPGEIDILKAWCREIEALIRSQPARGIDPPSGGQ